jgi:hypothetical protein
MSGLTPYDFGSTGAGDGVDNTAPLAAMFAAATDPSSEGVYLPPGKWRATTANWPLSTGLIIRGSGRDRAKLIIESGPVFTWDTAIRGVRIEDLSVVSIGGTIFAPGVLGGINAAILRNLFLHVVADDAAIWHQVNAGSFISVTIQDVEMQRPQSGTVTPFRISNSGGGANCNRLSNVRVNGSNNTNTPFFLIESTLPGSFAANWTITNLLGEQNPGGLLHVNSATNWQLINVTDMDASVPYMADLVRLGQYPGGPLCSDMTLVGVSRSGSSLAPGVSDINADGCYPLSLTMVACNPPTRTQPPVFRGASGTRVGSRSAPAQASGTGPPPDVLPIGSTYTQTDPGSVRVWLRVSESGWRIL